MGGAVVSRLIILGVGTLYPAYSSYKAVKSANVRQYVRWMMYWVIFALFITVETFTDLLFSWVPFYYEIKVAFVLWLLSPYTKGAAFLYRRFVHPMLSKREPEIDEFLSNAKKKSYATMLDVGSRGINVAANAVVTAAVKGQAVVSDRLKSFSVNDISRLSDETPIHSMNPAAYNPPRERELLSRTPDGSHFSMGDMPLARSALHQNQEPMPGSESQGIEMASGPPAEMRLPPSGYDAIAARSQMTTAASVSPPSDQYNANLGSQYKAYSMMNLSSRQEQGQTIMTRTIEFTTAPPEVSVDDSVIPDHSEFHVPDERSYGTLPRQRKKKHKKDKDSSSSSSSIRRSKRKTKVLTYDESGDEHEE